MEKEIAPAFPTLIGRFHPPDSEAMSRDLRRLVLEREQKEPNDAHANVSRRGHYHTVHNHPGSCWSGVYYVDCGTESEASQARSGVLDLLDPRPFTEMVPVPGEPYGQKICVKPKPGMMLVFPGFLYHFVHPFDGDGERISIAFNARTDRR